MSDVAAIPLRRNLTTVRHGAFACHNCAARLPAATVPGIDFCANCKAAMVCSRDREKRYQSRPLTRAELERLARIEDYGEIETPADLADLVIEHNRRTAPAARTNTKRALIEFFGILAALLVLAAAGYFLDLGT